MEKVRGLLPLGVNRVRGAGGFPGFQCFRVSGFGFHCWFAELRFWIPAFSDFWFHCWFAELRFCGVNRL